MEASSVTIKLTVDINAVRAALAFLDHIDSFPFDEITWMDGEEIITVPPKAAETWKFAGLCNHSFVEHEGWKFDQGFIETVDTPGIQEITESTYLSDFLHDWSWYQNGTGKALLYSSDPAEHAKVAAREAEEATTDGVGEKPDAKVAADFLTTHFMETGQFHYKDTQ